MGDMPFLELFVSRGFLLIYLALIVAFLIHLAIIGYHWLTYSISRTEAMGSLMLHTAVGGGILFVMGAVLTTL